MAIGLGSCSKDPDVPTGQVFNAISGGNSSGGNSNGGDVVAPAVTTAVVSEITQTTAIGGGNVTSDGGATVTECGICWSTSHNPTINSNHAASGSGTGNYTVEMTGLKENTTYYVKAYAINKMGVAYGIEESFVTKPFPSWTNGVLPGLFSVSDTSQISFSQGNLQYKATANVWRFAENQWDYVGFGQDNGNVYEDGTKCDNNLISPIYGGWIDLFGWGTSGWNSGANCYQPWSTSDSPLDYYPGGLETADLTGEYANADWGVYNRIYNGGNMAGQWRTLTSDEWNYVLRSRNTPSGVRFAKAIVNDVKGVILLPDNWSIDYYNLNNPNPPDYVTFSANEISSSDWINSLEAYGAVFLPAAGAREIVSSEGYYWSSSCRNSEYAYNLYISSYHWVSVSSAYRYCGLSVRLVCPAGQ